jgi:GTP pyrophosphokinase
MKVTSDMISGQTGVIQFNQSNVQVEKDYNPANIKRKFEDFIKNCRRCKEPDDIELLQKAFNIAAKAFNGIKKNSQEYYLEHSIEVAKIVTNEIGLGVRSAVVALLHDIVDETEFQIDDIEQSFGEKTTSILRGLTKIREVIDNQNVVQAEAFRKILLTLSDDIRVIFIKIADRLHHMRTIDAYSESKRIKIITESLYVYVPLAHRLGLYNIKTELEDLSLKFRHPEIYQEISGKIIDTEKKRTQFITNFSLPIIKELDEHDIKFEIEGRTKSIYSIWNKMQKKHVGFNEVYDLFAIRIVFDPVNPENEIEECWKIYSLIAKKYPPKIDRIRDWITTPKPNGYEALHITVLGTKDRWVEVQIRSKRMNDLAEMGFAAHWKYKGITDKKSELDLWIKEIKEKLGDANNFSQDFFDSFNLNLFSSEVLVFTPKGEIITLPKDATVLDFAFEIHTDLAYNCIGAKIGRNVVPLNHILSSGDIIEILSSTNQKPTEQWYHFVTTAKSRRGLNKVFHIEKLHDISEGKKIFKYLVAKDNMFIDNKVMKKVLKHYHLASKKELYLQIGRDAIDRTNLISIINQKSTVGLKKYWKLRFFDNKLNNAENQLDSFNEIEEIRIPPYVEIASCCKPIPGDNIIGYEISDNKIIVHKADCLNVQNIISVEGKRVIKAEWIVKELLSQLFKIELNGKDRPGIANQVTSLISKELNVNIKSLHFDTSKNLFYGFIEVFLPNETVCAELVKTIRDLQGIKSVNILNENNAEINQ